MESISSLTKKICHHPSSIISVILLGLITAIALVHLLVEFTIFHLFVFLMVLFFTVSSSIYVTGNTLGCTLLRIPITVLTIIFFSMSLIILAVGVTFTYQKNAENFINSILAEYGYVLSTTPKIFGIFIIMFGTVALFLSFCLLSGVRYFGSVKKCLKGEIKRGGAKLFGRISIFTFILSICVIVVQVIILHRSSNLNKIFEFPRNLTYAEIALGCILLLFVGISANTFSKKTYAFKVFENQMMKVEINADGTVYVPIKEENEYNFNNVSQAYTADEISSETKNSATSNVKKPFISDGQFIPSSQMADNKKSGKIEASNESNII